MMMLIVTAEDRQKLMNDLYFRNYLSNMYEIIIDNDDPAYTAEEILQELNGILHK